MANSRDTNRAISVDHLVDDAVRTNAEGPETTQSATKQVAGMRFSLQQAEGLRHSIYQRPIEPQQIPTSSASEHDSRHG